MSTTNKAPAATSPIMSKRQILLVMIGLMAGMFLSALDQTVVSTSMRTISDDLHGMSLQAWVTTAYLIMSTISTPLYGKLSDIFGRRILFIIAISIFLLGSLLAGTAGNMYELASFRAIQGLGAGGLMALPLAIMGDMLAPRERAKYQGFFLAVFGVSSVIGPLIGGVLSGTHEILFLSGWRWVFLINLPIGLIALAIVLRFLHLPSTHRRVRIDWWGATTVITATVPLLIVAEQGREWGWDSPAAFFCYGLGILSTVAFILIQRAMGDDALIPLKMFKSQTFSVSTILGVFVGFGMFGAMMTIPLYLQLVKGSTPTESGFQMLPMILGLMIASIASGQLMARTGSYKWFPRVGTAFMVLGFYVLTFLTSKSDITLAMLGMFLMGLGLGQLMQTLTVASQNSVGPRDIGVATSSSTFFRSMGGTAGTAILFSALFARIPETLAAAFGTPAITSGITAAMQDPAVAADPKNAQILALYADPTTIGTALNGDTSFLNNADPRLAEPFLVGFAQATVSIYWIGFFVLAVAFVLSCFLKAQPLRQKSAMEEAADEDAVLLAERAAEMMGSMIEPGTATGQIALAQAEEREAARKDHRDKAEAKAAAKLAKGSKPQK
ncbi:MDR family MFS transporter [Alpinimonas psychrophila]|uniref:EmrB/QacA subfamily drug resistance transporter n=1 Tax=Alpinimonas psychrophila TaxID=748908 RepID=A0A7W3JUX8_9MICO|nr:MDR family MFS transporter [Alpinimonas psychrophila]MBA8829582.1 EmrB/QacA subfamily drug resistance transporter [Alpinimonas psychrophila]